MTTKRWNREKSRAGERPEESEENRCKKKPRVYIIIIVLNTKIVLVFKKRTFLDAFGYYHHYYYSRIHPLFVISQSTTPLPSANHKLISLSADSTESEPWIIFLPTSTA